MTTTTITTTVTTRVATTVATTTIITGATIYATATTTTTACGRHSRTKQTQLNATTPHTVGANSQRADRRKESSRKNCTGARAKAGLRRCASIAQTVWLFASVPSLFLLCFAAECQNKIRLQLRCLAGAWVRETSHFKDDAQQLPLARCYWIGQEWSARRKSLGGVSCPVGSPPQS